MAQPNYHGPLSPVKHSMLRRMPGWDYQARRIYMVTLTTQARRPLLGTLAGNLSAPEGSPDYPHIVPTFLGLAVEKEIGNLPTRYPQLKVLTYQLMPDHLHILIFVRDSLPMHFGKIVAGFKIGCTQQYRALTHSEDSLWEPKFHDRLLQRQGQLKTLFRYIEQNPYRLMVKRSNPSWFHEIQELKAGGYSFHAIGNRFLLEQPDIVQVQCSRRITPEQLNQYKEELFIQATEGAVLISPCISPGEQQIMREARESGLPIIVILENGFSELYKPQGAYFEACAAGKLLMLAPWPHHNERRPITRAQCLDLNTMAKTIAQ